MMGDSGNEVLEAWQLAAEMEGALWRIAGQCDVPWDPLPFDEDSNESQLLPEAALVQVLLDALVPELQDDDKQLARLCLRFQTDEDPKPHGGNRTRRKLVRYLERQLRKTALKIELPDKLRELVW